MTARPAAAPRTFAFGDLDRTVWGAAWLPDPTASGFVSLGAGERAILPKGRVEGTSDDSEWRLVGDRVDLTVSAAAQPVANGAPEGKLTGFDQLCAVRGSFVLDEIEHVVESLGHRGWRTEPVDLDRFESIREVSGWFEPDRGFALVAFRARKARGHDADVVAAAVLEPDGASAVADPRLSTTYTTAGLPLRAGLELWIGEDDSAEADDRHHHYPRRAAGEATGIRAEGAVGDLDVQAELFRWHSRGQDGAGVYLLARRR